MCTIFCSFRASVPCLQITLIFAFFFGSSRRCSPSQQECNCSERTTQIRTQQKYARKVFCSLQIFCSCSFLLLWLALPWSHCMQAHMESIEHLFVYFFFVFVKLLVVEKTAWDDFFFNTFQHEDEKKFHLDIICFRAYHVCVS